MKNEKKDEELRVFSRGMILYCVLLFAIPSLAGGILSGVFWNLIYLETLLVVAALIGLIVWIWRPRARENAYYRQYKTLAEDKTTKEYSLFRKRQLVLLIEPLIMIGISLLVFLIRYIIYAAQ